MYRGERLFNFLPLYVGEPLKRPPELPPRHMTNIYPPCNLGNYIQFSILRCKNKKEFIANKHKVEGIGREFNLLTLRRIFFDGKEM